MKVTVSHLEMRDAGDLRAVGPPSPGVVVRRVDPPDAAVNRDMYKRVGADWSWYERLSWDDARCDAITSGPQISVPVLVVGNSADDACTPSHTQRLYDAVTHDHKHLHVVQGATHYYTGPNGREHQAEAVSVIDGFLDDLGLAPAHT